MRRLSVCMVILAFMVSGMCYGFDVEKYVQDHNEVYNFVEDVNTAKTEMLSKEAYKDFGKTKNGITLGELFLNMLSKPPFDKVRVIAVVVPLVSDESSFSWTKCQVIQEMIQREATKKLERYGVDVVNAIDVGIPLLRLRVIIEDAKVDGSIIYATDTEIELNEVLIDPVTHLKTVATTWDESSTTIHGSDKNLEEFILRSQGLRVDDFIRSQYQQCVFREVKHQLQKDGKLPPFLKGRPTKRDKTLRSKQ